MKNYYIVNFGEVVSTAKFLGKFEEIWNAKDAAFDQMQAGDMLVGFAEDVSPEYTDQWGYETVDVGLADEDERTRLLVTDDTLEDIPEGLYYWEDDTQDTTFYNPDGTVWDI